MKSTMIVFVFIFLTFWEGHNCFLQSSSILKLRHCRSQQHLLPIQPLYFVKKGNEKQIEEVEVEVEKEERGRINAKLSFSQIAPFIQIAYPFFKEDDVAKKSLAGVVALTLLNSGISVAFSFISRDFYNALNNRDEVEFYQKIGLFFGFLLLAVPVSVAYRFYREKLSLYWREALTARVLSQYYSNKTFYTIETLRDENLDNPDQRISEDIRAFTRTSLDFFITLLTSLIDLVSFSAILFQIYPGLFVAIILYAGAGSLVTTKLGQSLVGLNYDRLIKEANFRFSLIRTRENAESIAFYDSNATIEQEGLLEIFKDLLGTQLGIVNVQRNLEVFTTSYRYLVQILPSLIVAPLYFAKKVELGTISQSYGAFNHILGDFSIIINQFEALSSFSAGLTRLSTFLERINGTGTGTVSDWEIAGETRPRDSPLSLISLQLERSNAPTLLTCSNLTVSTPDGSRTLIGGISTASNSDSNSNSIKNTGIDVTINVGDRILIVGPSGAGKSSFVRAIAGLWRVGDGKIKWNLPAIKSNSNSNSNKANSLSDINELPKDVFFLPQKPYNLLGSLRQQIMYPSFSHIRKQKSTPMGGEGKEERISASGNGDDNGNNIDIVEKSFAGMGRAESQGDSGSGSESESESECQHLLDILDKVSLNGLAARVGSGDPMMGLNVAQDWSKILSLGEQQRLAFARVLYNRPTVVVCDEATSALDLVAEKKMYDLLREMDPATTCISVGHRPSLLQYHTHSLRLGGAGCASFISAIDHTNDVVEENLFPQADRSVSARVVDFL